jgi:hypothetical protein
MFVLYLLVKLDSIQGLFIGLSVGSGIIAFCLVMFYAVTEGEASQKIYDTCKWYRNRIFIPLFIFSIILATLLPSTKETAFIYLASKITQSEQAQSMGKNLINIPDKALEIINIKMNEYLNDVKGEVKQLQK